MRHRKTTIRLKREKAPRAALMQSLARSIVLHGKVETTLAKAKAVRPFVEKLITLGKKKDRRAQRLLASRIRDKNVVKKLQAELSEQFATREGGYTRIRRTGFRQGDGSEMALLTLVKK
ncbi:MAG: 50S ribosomal protein L17 [bacterium]|nr:50S ribosomal protein L17 [bacterium]